nr:MAG TPA: hypothetical protein [Caudoviricetes sp.]
MIDTEADFEHYVRGLLFYMPGEAKGGRRPVYTEV